MTFCNFKQKLNLFLQMHAAWYQLCKQHELQARQTAKTLLLRVVPLAMVAAPLASRGVSGRAHWMMRVFR